jgi:hypothetical protein
MTGTGGFQTQVYLQPAAAIAGDRATQNPLFSYWAGPGALVAGSSLFVGRFAWTTAPLDPNGGPTIANSFLTAGAPNPQPQGLVLNAKQALNPTYLSNAGMQIQPGYEVDLMIGGDFWVVNSGTTQALPQSPGQASMKAYANLATGKVTFALTGAPTTSATSTASSIAAASSTFTGSISGNVLTVTTWSGTSVAETANLSVDIFAI